MPAPAAAFATLIFALLAWGLPTWGVVLLARNLPFQWMAYSSTSNDKEKGPKAKAMYDTIINGALFIGGGVIVAAFRAIFGI